MASRKMPPLHQVSPRPYYILAPEYRRSSAGIRVMHLLCHLLNRCGQDAYMFPTTTNPLWHTPLLTQELRQQHLQAGREPIVVYPEVVRGNPCKGRSVVRYLLNVPGLLGGDEAFAASDMVFAYGQSLLPQGVGDDHILFMPPIDTSIFHNQSNPYDQQRKGWLIYPGRHSEALKQHPDLAAKCTVITNQWPATPEEMAELFRRSERVYCFSSTSIALEAILCGCPAVVLKSPFFDGVPIGVGEFGTHGLAFDDSPQALAHAVAGLPIVEQTYAMLQDRFWEQLQVFIDKTQAMPFLPAPASDITPQHNSQAERTLAVQQWLRQRTPSDMQATLMAERLQRCAQDVPRFDFIIIAQGQPAAVEATRQSLLEQSYPYIDIHVAQDPHATTLNEVAVRGGQGQWLCFVPAGTTFTAFGLFVLALELLDAPDVRALYADEIVRFASGDLDTLLRPDFNLDLFLSAPACMARHWFYRRDVFIGAGGFDPNCAGALELGLLLHLIEDSDGLNGLAHVSEPVCISACNAGVHNPQEQAVLEGHLHRRGYLDASVQMHLPGIQRIHYRHQDEPWVSIIIEAGERFDRLQRCVTSVMEKTTYRHYEILLLDNGTADPATRAWLDGLAAQGVSGIRVLRGDHQLDANIAVEHARGDYVLLLHGASVVVEGHWLGSLLNHAQRPEVGVVGGKLLHPDGTLAQAGLVLGLNGPAGLAFAGEAGASGCWARAEADQNLSAVAAACMMIRRSLYQALGGQDLLQFNAAGAAIDLCLKVGQEGYLTVWTPHAVLVYEGPSAEATADEQALYHKWLALIARDPAYNRNLSLHGAGFALEPDPGLARNPLTWRPLPVVLAMSAGAEAGAGSRIIDPGLSMNIRAMADVRLAMRPYSPAELERLKPDAWVMQVPETEAQCDELLLCASFTGAFKVLEVEAASLAHSQGQVALQRLAAVVDRLVVPTEALAEALRGSHADIRVVPESLHPARWGALQAQRRTGPRPRIGWVGDSVPGEEQALLLEIVTALHGQVDWICLGPCAEQIQPYLSEMHAAVALDQSPGTLCALNLDLALVPAVGGVYSHCRSNLPLLQLGACGFPVVCSDVLPWQGLPVTPVANDAAHWLQAIGLQLAQPEVAATRGDLLRETVLSQWMLDDPRLRQRFEAWLAP